MTPPRLFLLDAMALIYRAHFAFIKNPRITSAGVNTSAVFGFTNTVLEVIAKEKPTHLGVAFDTAAPTARHETFADYKAHREEAPEDIISAIPITLRLLEAMSIPVILLDGYEADDIIGTLAIQAEKRGLDTYMMTPDKDYAQLVSDHIFMYRPAAFGNGPEVYDRSKVIEKYGVPPEQIADLLGLKGDASDNIPGIPKVGEKTALELIRQFGSVEQIIQRAQEVTKPAIRESILQNSDLGLLSKKLATIQTDVPVILELDKLILSPPNRTALLELFRELEFKTLGARALEILPGGPNLGGTPDLFNNASETPNSEDSNQESTSDSTPESTPQYSTLQLDSVSYTAASSPSEIKELMNLLMSAQEVCLDTETTSTDPMNARLIGMSFSVKPQQAWYVPVPENALEREQLLTQFLPFFNSSILKVGQNLKYDLMIFLNHGINIKGPFYDTMLAHYVVDPDGKHGMDAMAIQYLKYQPVSISTLIGKKGKNQLSMAEVPLADIVPYACEDADITLQLKSKIETEIDKTEVREVLDKIELPLLPVLLALEWEGVKIDQPALVEYSEQLEKEISGLEKEIFEIAGVKFNIQSPKQLGEIIFDKLKLEKGKKTATGQYSTNEEVLTRLSYSHELPAKILDYRQLNKLKATYVDALPLLINPKTGRVHTTFAQAVAATGRLSSNNPNLQNIPIRSERGREVRKAFVPRAEGYVLLSADYSQIELRIMAGLSQDKNMVEAFHSGEDIHRATAAKVFGVNPEAVTSDMRAKAKMVNFGIIYGISAFGLAQRLSIPRGEAKEIIDSYFAQYSGVKTYMDNCIQLARDKGYTLTLMGRKRYLPDINSRNATVRGFAERNAINSPIQGSAADLIKLAMIKIHHKLSSMTFKSKMILQVHDELLFDVYEPELEEIKPIILQEMTSALNIGVPLEAGVGVGKNWLDAH
ncbi:MAG: DNA polymerase I [Sphingobacteriia bacterium]|nr:DNA polymerase I [Sphingobacteriia bacterium]